MQDFGVNLICVEDGIDSSKDAGKLMISVLSAVAEIERENIRVQTMEGRIQKAREGRWNGGFAPYGYQLVDGELQINEEEAAAIRVIFEQYVTTDTGANGVAKYLENHGIRKIQRQNGKNPLFDAHLVRLILKNPVYCGKIAYGRRKTEKVHGTRNEYHLVEQDNYILVDGLHEAIIAEVIICGLNGSGKNTLEKVLAKKLHFHFIDNENLYFPKTDKNSTYAFPRTREEVEKLLWSEIRAHENFVFTSVKGDYGETIYPFFQYAVLIDVPKDIRIWRVRNRSFQKFGERMLIGGDLHEQEEKFFDFVEAQPENTVEEWVQSLKCPVLRIDGTKPIEENVNFIMGKNTKWTILIKEVKVA